MTIELALAMAFLSYVGVCYVVGVVDLVALLLALEEAGREKVL